MAVTQAITHTAHQMSVVATFTADGDADIAFPDKAVDKASFQSDGVDGGGTLTVLASNDGSNFVAIGFNTSADPRNTTAVSSVTAAGAWLIPQELLGFKHFRFHLTGSTTPTLVLTINFTTR